MRRLISNIARVDFMNASSGFGVSDANIFWGEIAPSEHVAQFYEHEGVLLDTLTGFVAGGLDRGESTIVIATPEHLLSIDQRLRDSKTDLARAVAEDRYITLDAESALASFMVKDWPDEDLFADFINQLILRASANDRRVRAFGEMVALLWDKGLAAATVRLEHLWHQFCQNHAFSLFCAYPRAGFTSDPTKSLADICAAHSRVI
ncbi:MAG: MEDS domain-containing protein [Terracidiphilus sp.]